MKNDDLYSLGTPDAFNSRVVSWLEGRQQISNHDPPKTFRYLIDPYNDMIRELREGGDGNPNKTILNNLTKLLMNPDIKRHLKEVYGDDTNEGFRSDLSQALAKNVGENFVNLIVYNLASNLRSTGLCVDKGLPPKLKQEMTLKMDALGGPIAIPIEGDLCIFRYEDQTQAIVLNAKTRLKEISHIGALWSILEDIAKDESMMKKWGIVPPARKLKDVAYCFATADMIPPGRKKTQGPDIERDKPRNLIRMDAAFFDWFFVSKSGIKHTGKSIGEDLERTTLFHELATIYDLIEHKFKVKVFPDGHPIDNAPKSVQQVLH